MPKTILETFLKDRLLQLKQRKEAVPHFLKQEGKNLSRRTAKMIDVHALEKDIEETEAAIQGIDIWKRIGRPLTNLDTIKLYD